MQPATKPPTTTVAALRGDEAGLYRRCHRRLLRVVDCHVIPVGELIEDACQNACVILLRRQPDRDRVFPWRCTVAIHQAYRLLRTERRRGHLGELSDANGLDAMVSAHVTIDDHLQGRSALRLVAELPERQPHDLALLVASYSYRELAEMTAGRTTRGRT